MEWNFIYYNVGIYGYWMNLNSISKYPQIPSSKKGWIWILLNGISYYFTFALETFIYSWISKKTLKIDKIFCLGIFISKHIEFGHIGQIDLWINKKWKSYKIFPF